MWSVSDDARLRTAAMSWLAVRTHDGLYSLRSEDIAEFEFEGERFRLMDPQRGIRKPKELTSALSIRTVWRADDEQRPYDDKLGHDGLVRYKWRGDNPRQAENVALRAAMTARVPLIWFWGTGTATYQAIFPIYLIGEEPEAQQFIVATEGLQDLVVTESPIEDALRRYVRAETVRRLHQPVFRGMVMRAYGERCAVCSLRHSELLDAAHIVEDRHELGVAAVRNGLALCKIHHAAYDSKILGVTPDRVIQIRTDILDETDGPLLEHGLKALHGRKLVILPRIRREQPDRDLLALRYQRFLAG